MNELFVAAAEFQDLAEAEGWAFCLIGGLAVARWGMPRLTADVDVSLLTGFGNEPPFVQRVLERFRPRVDDPHEFASRTRMLLVRASNGVMLDIALAALPYEEEVMRRATVQEFAPGVRLTTCSAEDLLVAKCFAGRPQDWLDVEGILARNGEALDLALVEAALGDLCEAAQDDAALRGLRERL